MASPSSSPQVFFRRRQAKSWLMRRRHSCFLLALTAFLLHASFAYIVVPFSVPSSPVTARSTVAPIALFYQTNDNNIASEILANKDNYEVQVSQPIARQTRVVSPLAFFMTLLLGPSKGNAILPSQQTQSTTITTTTTTASRSSVPATNSQQPKTNARRATAFSTTNTFPIAISKHFPRAQPSSVVAHRVVSVLQQRNYKPSNTLLGSSLCSDEINYTPTSLIHLLERQLYSSVSNSHHHHPYEQHGTFSLGGLGGLPFVGTSGMTAFYHHVPHQPTTQGESKETRTSKGKLVILFGPHVGVSESGEVGKILRPGMQEETFSCGAALAAYQAISNASHGNSETIKNNKNTMNHPTFDFQESYIIENLKTRLASMVDMESKRGGDEAIVDVTNKMFELISELIQMELDAVMSNNDFWLLVSEVTLLGGIVINRNSACGEDYFDLRTIQSISPQGPIDLFDTVFVTQVSQRGYQRL